MTQISVEIQIDGRLGSSGFVPWINRHAAKLGVQIALTSASSTRVSLQATGAAEMLRALALGCSLGPYDVWIDEVTTSPVEPTQSPA